jgi:hypothetical protein
MDDSMDNIDLSDVDEYFRTIDGGVTYEAEIMDKISMKIVYTNTENEIFHTIDHELPLRVTFTESSLSEEDLINIIRKNRTFENKRYKCDGIIKYFVSTDPQTIFDNIDEDQFIFQDDDCFSHFEMPQNISFPPSLFIFHSINSILILFREMVLVNSPKHCDSPVSIIKKFKNKITKRVRISDCLPSYSTTRKYRQSKNT